MNIKKKIKNYIKNYILNNFIKYRIITKSKSLILTFDDGPNEKITPLVLKRLKEYNARAVFFIVGRFALERPDLVNDIKKNGHIIGNHTYEHSNNNYIDYDKLETDIIKCQDIIKGITGESPTLFRPPLGLLSFKSYRIIRKLNLDMVLWSNEGGESGNAANEREYDIGERLKKTLIPGEILLLHDNNSKVPKILDIILPSLSNQGIDLFNGVNSLIVKK